MLRQLTKYGVALIALYLIVANSSGFGKALTSSADSVAKVTKTLQARA